jgi:queuosine precursor transporter
LTRTIGITALACFIFTVYAANWLIEHVGFVSVGFGYQAPAGVFAAGAAFLLRDIVHRTLGPWIVVLGILAGAALSYTVSPAFAVASAVAFLASELADMTVYTPLSRRSATWAVVASNTAGAVIDSVIFLWLAFSSLAFLEGQVIGKLEMTLLALPLVILARHHLKPQEDAR